MSRIRTLGLILVLTFLVAVTPTRAQLDEQLQVHFVDVGTGDCIWIRTGRWNNTTIEIFNPPYLYRGARPVISSAPSSVQRGQNFIIGSPDSAMITKVVLARPMAVTHQTDTEQKILEMPYAETSFSTFGTIATQSPVHRGAAPGLPRLSQTSGAVADRFPVGNNFDALAFVAADLGFGPNLFYYLRHDGTGFSTFGTVATQSPVHRGARRAYRDSPRPVGLLPIASPSATTLML
jgi:hypothetical protein